MSLQDLGTNEGGGVTCVHLGHINVPPGCSAVMCSQQDCRTPMTTLVLLPSQAASIARLCLLRYVHIKWCSFADDSLVYAPYE